MKSTIEYKILKYLSDNDNGELLDISGLYSDHDLLRDKLVELSKKGYVKRYFGHYIAGVDATCIKAKILLDGTEYVKGFGKTPMTTYQKIQLPFFIFFGLATFYFGYISYNLNEEKDTLNSNFELSKTESKSYKDSLFLLKEQIKTLQKKTVNKNSNVKELKIMTKNL